MWRRLRQLTLMGAMLCSASTLANPGQAFKTPDEAALDALDWLVANYPEYKKFEYGGCIYKSGDEYFATEPKTQGQPKWCIPEDPPPGTKKAGDYHNHIHDGFERFSKEDKYKTGPERPAYLLTPKGWVKKWTGTETVLRKGQP